MILDESAVPFPVSAEAVPAETVAAALEACGRDFVRATALAPFLSVTLARSLCGGAEAGPLLDQAAQAGLGAWETSPRGERVFRYHRAVREQLGLRSAAPELNAKERRSAAVIARWLLEEQGEPHLALRYAAWSRDTALVASAGIRAFPFTQETADIATRLIRQLPAEERNRHPMLALWLGAQQALLPGGLKTAEALFLGAGSASSGYLGAASPTERSILLGLQSYLLRRAGKPAQARTRARAASDIGIALMRTGDVDSSLSAVFASAMHQVGVGLMYAGTDTLAEDHFRALLEYCDEFRIGHRRNSSASALAAIHAQQGLLQQAERWISLIRERDWPREWPTGYPATYRDLAEMAIAAYRADVVALEVAIDRMRPYEAETEHWDVMLFARVCLQLLRGDSVAAALWFDRVVSERVTSVTHPRIRAGLKKTELLLRAVGAEPRQRVSVRADAGNAALIQALTAIIAARRGGISAAQEALTRAERAAKTPLEEAFVGAAALVVTTHASPRIEADVRRASARIAFVVEQHGIRLPLLVISSEEREALSPSLSRSWSSVGPRFTDVPVPICDGRPRDTPRLTEQEAAVIAALLQFARRADIAAHLHLSLNTVKVHLSAAYRKLGAHSRAEALMKAALYNLLPDDV